ncbi:MAG: protein translocase subunit SecD [Coriobacteriia bacterium]|nr:protein translocase subunit SecD [Coriobacteriia bacterium]
MAEKLKKKGKKSSLRGNDRRNIWLIVLTVVLVIGSIFAFTPPNERINQGLDIQGGLSVVLSASNSDGSAVSDEDMEKSRAIIENRVNMLGASEATVQAQGSNQILVQIPGLSDTETALNTIGKTGKLEFTRLDSITDENVVTAIRNGQYADEGSVTDAYGNTFPSGKSQHLKIQEGTYTPLITGENISQVSIGKASEASAYYAVNLRLDAEGTKKFAEATKELAPTKGEIVIILDGEVQSAPAVQSEIPSGEVSITGRYTVEEAQSLQTVLESGSLPVSFQFETAQTVGPTLGQEALMAGLIAAVVGLILVMLYLLFFYTGLGLINAGAIAVFAILYLGILAVLSAFGLFSLSLAGIAGIVLTIGMAADSSVLTVERFREEIREGRSIKAASLSGVRHAIMTSIDADLVTLVAALSLFFLASASVKGFGLTLALGIICDIVMMLIFKAPLIRLLATRAIAKNPGFWGIKDCQNAAIEYEKYLGVATPASRSEEGSDQPKVAELNSKGRLKGRFIKKDINFMGYRKVFLCVAAVVICVCLGIAGIKGMNFGIEFVGGTSITFNQTGDITTEQMRDAFNQAGESEAVIQTTQTNGQPGFIVRTTNTSAATSVVNTLGLSTDSFQVDTIGPGWGASVIKSSVMAFLIAILLIIIYIGIRFRDYKMGITAVAALFHDLILVLGVYCLIGWEITPNTIAAMLTILGYSLYDTVVVFHRIDENMKQENIRCTFTTMANHSINQVLCRTINTSITSLLPVLIMLFFGGETLKDFALAIAVGLISGSYSSIAIATPLYVMWKNKEKRNAKLLERFGTDVVLYEFAKSDPTSMPPKGEKAQEAEEPAEVVEVAVEAPAKEAKLEKKAGATVKLTTSQRKRKAKENADK